MPVNVVSSGSRAVAAWSATHHISGPADQLQRRVPMTQSIRIGKILTRTLKPNPYPHRDPQHKQVTLFAPYWLDNRTGMDLAFQDAPPSGRILGVRSRFDYNEVVSPGELRRQCRPRD